uniref:Uncharacterized protein n=1 Tax=Anguilla anguilla TaxID=7936 RepID=A0A0E9RVJ2_ANGAN
MTDFLNPMSHICNQLLKNCKRKEDQWILLKKMLSTHQSIIANGKR